MTKELVTIEFRYHDKPLKESDSIYKNKTITIGVFDTFEEAVVEGNKALEIFEKYFKLHKFTSGIEAKRERFSKTGGCFGTEERLISPLAYLKTPFYFYAKITKLKHEDVEDTILGVIEATKRYREYQLSQKEE